MHPRPNLHRFGSLSDRDEAWRDKPALRVIYEDIYRRVLGHCRPGPLLEIGGGIGNLKAFRPEIDSLDIQAGPGLDVVGDAHRLPFAERSFESVVMVDVLHHLARPRLFLAEIVRVLRPGGRLVVCEPAITPLSFLAYKAFHSEPVSLDENPLVEGVLPSSRERSPDDANQAIPTLLFGRDSRRVEALFPQLLVHRPQLFSLLAYPLTGGFQSWSLLPGALAQPLLRLEDCLAPILGRAMAFRLLGVIECKDSRPDPATQGTATTAAL